MQPDFFGDGYLKSGLLVAVKGLPPLLAMDGNRITEEIRNGFGWAWPTMATQRRNWLTQASLTPKRPQLRSQFHPGMAAAMALQWGG